MFRQLSEFACDRVSLVALLSLTLFSGFGSGCSRFNRTKQCRALIALVNPALDDVLTITHAHGAGGADGRLGPAAPGTGGVGGGAGSSGSGLLMSNGYVAAAGRYERLAKQLGPMEFGSEDMAKLVAEYAGLLNEAAQALRKLGPAVDSNNHQEAERLNRELERITSHERSVVARMDAWCQP